MPLNTTTTVSKLILLIFVKSFNYDLLFPLSSLAAKLPSHENYFLLLLLLLFLMKVIILVSTVTHLVSSWYLTDGNCETPLAPQLELDLC